jgi:8-oxo-dGTP pyrophosphatase MutT (NUDIX family)
MIKINILKEEKQEDTNNVSKVMAVTTDNLVLILKRADTGEWDLPGGHAHEGESVESAAERETYEETGLKIHDIDALRTQEVTFNGRVEQITYLSARLGSTAMVLDDKIDLDTNENTEFLFIKPMQIDGLMNNATQNLKNMANDIKSLPIEEQTEPFQKKMKAKHTKMKKRLIGGGGNKKK